MKTSIILVTIGAGLAAAQSGISSLPQCGQVCISNMLALAPSLGCPSSGSSVNATCLCENPNFGYGVRDCSNESCPTAADAQEVIQFGVKYCSSVLASAATATGTAATATGSGAATASGAAASGSAAAASNSAGVLVPVTTEALSGVKTNGGKTVTTVTGSTTLYSRVKATAITTETLATTEKTAGKKITTTTGTTTVFGVNGTPVAEITAKAGVSSAKSKASSAKSALSSAKSKVSSAKSAASNATKTGAGAKTKGGKATASASSSSSGNAAPYMTAAPGLIGAAALAVLAL